MLMCAVSYFSDGSMFIEPRNPPEAEREGPCEGVGGRGRALSVCVAVNLNSETPPPPVVINIINKN